MSFEELQTRLLEKFGSDSFTASEFRGNKRLIIGAERITPLMTWLKEDHGYDLLAELTAVDYLKYPQARDRYGVVYGLTNTQSGDRLWVKTYVNDPDPTLASVYPIWRGADWLEREVYDMYGIVFTGHPDLRRILLPEEFTSYPLRKDYPLRGKGERHNFPVLTRAQS